MKTMGSSYVMPVIVHPLPGEGPASVQFRHEHLQAEYDKWGGPLTKRELFAALALKGMLSNPETDNSLHIGKIAVKWADELIECLNEQKPESEDKI